MTGLAHLALECALLAVIVLTTFIMPIGTACIVRLAHAGRYMRSVTALILMFTLVEAVVAAVFVLGNTLNG